MLYPRRQMMVALALVALGAGTASADPVDDLFAVADEFVTQTARQAGEVVLWPDTGVVVTGIPEDEFLEHNTDYIVITDTGSGPVVSKQGAFGNPNWWTCTTSYGGGAPVTVTCDSAPQWVSSIWWNCGVMDVSAKALTTHRQAYPWIRDEVNAARTAAQGIISGRISAAPQRPDPGKIVWGQAAGRLACDSRGLETETATSAAPFQTAAAALNAHHIARFTCEARLAKGVASAPVAPYSVNCLDPRGIE